MKKSHAYALFVLVLIGCSNDNDQNLDVTREDLLGKWNYETQFVEWNGTGTTNEPVPYSGNQAGCEKDFIVHANSGSFTRDFTNADCGFEDHSFTWTVNGDKLQMTIGEAPIAEFKIESFDGNNLEVSSEFDTGFVVEKRTIAFSRAE